MVKSPVVDKNVTSGLALARVCFAKPEGEESLDMLDFTPRTIDLVTSNPSGSAGLTSFGNSKAESMTRALERGLETLRGDKAPEPCIAFARTQFEGKTRLVWGYPYSETVIEGLVAYPFLQLLKGRNTPMAFAITTMALGAKLRVAAYHNRFGYSIDMASFDSSVSEFMIDQAFRIIKTWFNLDQVEPTSGLTCREIFVHVQNYFTHSSIVMPNGMIYHGRKHGVPSGSFFTQIIDSIVNVIIAGTISSKFHLHVDKREIFVLGDDLLIWSDRDMDLTTMAKFASETFGVTFRSDKSKKFRSSETIQYLGREWTHGIPDLPLEEVIKRMVFPERFRKYSEDEHQRIRQAKLLFLSFASVYWCAWGLADDVIGTGRWSETPGAIETSIFGNAFDKYAVEPDHLSGLMRFLQMYFKESSVDIPHVATMFLL